MQTQYGATTHATTRRIIYLYVHMISQIGIQQDQPYDYTPYNYYSNLTFSIISEKNICNNINKIYSLFVLVSQDYDVDKLSLYS